MDTEASAISGGPLIAAHLLIGDKRDAPRVLLVVTERPRCIAPVTGWGRELHRGGTLWAGGDPPGLGARLRYSFVTAAVDAGVAVRDIEEAASCAGPRTTMREHRARHSLDRHATYIVAAFVAGAFRSA